MSITYEICRSDVKEIVEHIVTEHHGELFAAGVTIGCLYAFAEKDGAGQPKTAAVKLHGYPCDAVIRITPYKKRVQGIEDAEITIDGDWWTKATREEQEALIDHELTHLLVQYEENGSVKTDDHQRPKLKMRLHDSQIGVFKEIIKRHGNASIDAQVAHQFCGEYGQLLMEFATPEYKTKPPKEEKKSSTLDVLVAIDTGLKTAKTLRSIGMKATDADTLAAAGAPDRAFAAAGLQTISSGGEPLEPQEPLIGAGDAIPLKEAMGKPKRRR